MSHADQAPVHEFSQRWRDRREYRLAPGERIDPSEYGVEILGDREAKRFVVDHHYSGSYPAARLAVGLMRKTGIEPARLVGVCVFGVPMNQKSVPRYLGLAPNDGVELSRLVLLDEVLHSGESWFVARALSLLRTEKPGVTGVISYADPTERRDAAGNVFKCSHWGYIYQALSFGYAGKGTARTLLLSRSGQVVSQRALSKIRNEEQGFDYACRQLVELGAPERDFLEEPRAWVDRAIASDAFLKLKHSGNHVYLRGLDRSTRRHVESISGRGADHYPKGDLLAA